MWLLWIKWLSGLCEKIIFGLDQMPEEVSATQKQESESQN